MGNRRALRGLVRMAEDDAAPLDLAIDEINVARDRIDLKCSTSKPVRVWTWVDRGRNERGPLEFIRNLRVF